MIRRMATNDVKPCPNCQRMMTLLSHRLPPLQPRVTLPLVWTCSHCKAEFDVEQDPKDVFIFDLWEEKEAALTVLREVNAASITTLDGGTIVPVNRDLRERISNVLDPKKMSPCTLCGDEKGFWCDRQGRYWCVTCIEIALVQIAIDDGDDDY